MLFKIGFQPILERPKFKAVQMFKKPPTYNKKKWLKNHLEQILRLKEQGLTHQAIIEALKTQQNMPFELDESLLSRYLKEFSGGESTTLKTKTALTNKIDRQNDRLTKQNNEIQNLKRRLDRVLERNMQLEITNKNLKQRTELLEEKFLDGEARLSNLQRYNGYDNLNWKIKELEQRNDDLFQTVLRLERLSERLAEPHEKATAAIEQLVEDREQLEYQLNNMQAQHVTSERQRSQLEDELKALQEAHRQQLDELSQQNRSLRQELASTEKTAQKLVRITEDLSAIKGEKKELLQAYNALKQHSKRLESDLGHLEYQHHNTVQALRIGENLAQKQRFIIYALATACLIVIVLLLI